MSMRSKLEFFRWEHLPPKLQPVSKACAELAQTMVDTLPDTDQGRLGMQKLIEAKDCFVRARLELDA